MARASRASAASASRVDVATAAGDAGSSSSHDHSPSEPWIHPQRRGDDDAGIFIRSMDDGDGRRSSFFLLLHDLKMVVCWADRKDEVVSVIMPMTAIWKSACGVLMVY